MTDDLSVTGVLLAAGGGRRAGGPKALRRDDTGRSWLGRAVQVLIDGGCTEVVVVLGAGADEAERVLAAEYSRTASLAMVHVNPAWAEGLSSSLRVGLTAVAARTAGAALVHLVDLPDVGAAAVRRVVAQASLGEDVLARATYAGALGHPVLIGSAHLDRLAAELTGDHGAADYLTRLGFETVECGDLATGRDHDGPPQGWIRHHRSFDP